MGTIIQNFVNGLTTNGVLGASNINNASLNNITSISGPEMTLVSSATASASTSIEFTLGNFKEYQFYFVNIHPSVDDTNFQMNFSTDGGSNYNVTKSTTFFVARHRENDSGTNLDYVTNRDLAQSTANQVLNYDLGNLSDEDVCGHLHLFNPSSSTFVKHFIGRSIGNGQAEDCHDSFVAGYGNTTSPINAVKFAMSSGNIDAGQILLFGVN